MAKEYLFKRSEAEFGEGEGNGMLSDVRALTCLLISPPEKHLTITLQTML